MKKDVGGVTTVPRGSKEMEKRTTKKLNSIGRVKDVHP